MRKLLFALSGLLASAGVAAAAESACGKWDTSIGPLEEGDRLATSFCSAPKGEDYSVLITCIGGSMNLRFQPQIEGGGETYDKETVDYAIDGKSFAVATRYEELDGAFAADVDTSDPLVAAMKAGKTAVVTLKGIKAPAYKVPLKGFSKAITKLITNCE